ncbi:hypothetical protein IV203_000383 [Nitzschia inconspicua]|uniref:Uncharacterized protein n=1 Tax=Nitzschia inconspicua TaxID=303405 RepID=A0A9K3L565_9STRA|nr:hypothetical protein IV203_000383 [Nitzschia inconspicua]
MKIFITTTLALLSSLSFPLSSGGSLPSSSTKLAVVRPFSTHDSSKLLSSFDVWREFPPCSGKPSYTAHLVLAFSQSLLNSNVATEAMTNVGAMFDETQGFGRCFQRILGFGCNIEASLDVYNPARSNDMWVNGPNRAFERTFRAMQAGGYEYFFQMEIDSVPIQSFWLDTLFQESHDFAILGSRYRGYKWDSFYGELPLSLRTHINGNAVYNTSHVVLERLVTALEEEANTAGNAVPYDLRIAQILEEATTGRQASFDVPSDLPLPSSYFHLFSDLDLDLDQTVRETKLIGNYAVTNMVSAYLDSEIIVHGAKMHESWNETVMGNISLVVSDWSPSNVQFILETLKTSSHPFNEIIVMVPDDSTFDWTEKNVPTPIRFVPRGKSTSSMDLCNAPIKTFWMMKTSSFFQLRQKVPLLTHKGKPVVTFSYPSKETCYDFKSCIDDMKRAKFVSPSANRIFDDADMVYDQRSLSKFCSYIEKFHESPSATEYIAFLETMTKIEKIYHLSERRVEGLHSPFLQISESLLPAILTERRLQASNSSVQASNSTSACTGHANENGCTSSGCEWVENTSSCRSVPNAISSQQRSVSRSSTRPKYITALISISIAGASVALIVLMHVAYKRRFSGTASGSLEPCDGSRDPQNSAGGEHSDIGSSFMLASDFDNSKNDESMLEIDLNDGQFEETSNGVEFVRN